MTHVNIPGRIITQPPSQTGSLGEALIQQLRRDSKRPVVEPPRLSAQPRPDGRSYSITVNRAKLKIQLFAPAGYLMAEGTFASMSELSDNVANFLTKHPTTSVFTD